MIHWTNHIFPWIHPKNLHYHLHIPSKHWQCLGAFLAPTLGFLEASSASLLVDWSYQACPHFVSCHRLTCYRNLNCLLSGLGTSFRLWSCYSHCQDPWIPYWRTLRWYLRLLNFANLFLRFAQFPSETIIYPNRVQELQIFVFCESFVLFQHMIAAYCCSQKMKSAYQMTAGLASYHRQLFIFNGKWNWRHLLHPRIPWHCLLSISYSYHDYPWLVFHSWAHHKLIHRLLKLNRQNHDDFDFCHHFVCIFSDYESSCHDGQDETHTGHYQTGYHLEAAHLFSSPTYSIWKPWAPFNYHKIP